MSSDYKTSSVRLIYEETVKNSKTVTAQFCYADVIILVNFRCFVIDDEILIVVKLTYIVFNCLLFHIINLILRLYIIILHRACNVKIYPFVYNYFLFLMMPDF